MKFGSLLAGEKEEQLENEKTIEKKLHEAAINGEIPILLQLIQENPQILTSKFSSIPNNPLHTAVLLGHLDFTKELLNRNLQMANSLNSHGSSALHLASAKGNLGIVKYLLLINPDICSVLDRDGRNPLHLAAIKGRVAVLGELLRSKPEVARELTGRGETCLHLCVKYNRFEALKVLVAFMKKDDQFVNWKDSDGNTILHVAVAKKQIEVINYLLANTRVEIGARNANGWTALDVLMQSPGDTRDLEIKQCLLHRSVSRTEHTPFLPFDTVLPENDTTRKQPKKHKHTDWLGRKRNALMIVASLLATVAFQAGLSPPGGVWQGDYEGIPNGTKAQKPHEAGQSIMAYTLPPAYNQYMIFNTIAFLASLSIILLQVSGLPLRRRRWMWTQMVTIWIAITAQTITYFITFINMTPDHVTDTVNYVIKVYVLGWLSLMGIVFIGNISRAMLYVLRKYGYVKEKERREPLVYVEEEENDEL
ncbi:ankyrin repeat-containing protein BDA1-like [Olea europaea var. sylvestris]|uniref:ankyrin repeat-containing protein BDA1-like n=1 Tax=Olea europaea var. sylvestris TaxID=158386 RepID=UPI000C1D0379|nr:ankyrin repeat-containing protein BDA1-like [Olea europaea var. sylvestris]